MNTVSEDREGQGAASSSSTATPATAAQPVLPTLLFVHGACVRDADWWWSQMIQPLAARRIQSVAVALPSCGETGDALGDLAADVRACQEAIRGVDGPVVLCGHSYGGVIITEAGSDERVAQLVYITSVMPDTGQSQAEMIGGEPAPWLQPGEDTVGVDPDMVREYFLQDCDEATTEAAVARLARTVRPAASSDRVALDPVQLHRVHPGPRHARRNPARTDPGRRPPLEFDAGHHPFLSRPDAFAQLLVDEIKASSTTSE